MASRRIRIVVNSLGDFVDQVIKKIVLDIVANLKRAPSEGGTPVDTGWARANWIPNIGSPRSGTAGQRPDEGGRADTGAQDAGVAEVLTSYTARRGAVHITNNVPYIVFLNAGTSRQAPAGFVERAIQKAVRQDLPSALAGGATPRGTPPRDPVTGRFLRRRG